MKRVVRSIRCLLVIGLATVLWSLPVLAQATGYGERLTLHVEDAIGAPGRRVAVVFRAYASRPIGQGQLCFAVRESNVDQKSGAESFPLLSYEDSVVFSTAGDVQVEFVETTTGVPRYELRFTSPSATVNDYHGPLAAVFFNLHEDAVPGSRFELVIDPADTEFLDESGYPIAFDVTPAELHVRATAEPYSVAADVGVVVRGDTAEIGIRTAEPVEWARGRFGLRYDADILPGELSVRMDPRHGLASFDYDTPYPGLLIVDFASPDGSLNEIPGSVVLVRMDSSRAARPKASRRIWLDPALSWVVGSDGRPLQLVFEDDRVDLAAPSGRILTDPFESAPRPP